MKKTLIIFTSIVALTGIGKSVLAVNPPMTKSQADTMIAQVQQDYFAGAYATDEFKTRIIGVIKDLTSAGIPRDQWFDIWPSVEGEFGIFSDATIQSTGVDETSPMLGKSARYKSPSTADAPSHTYAAIITAVRQNHVVDLVVFAGSTSVFKYQIANGTGENQWTLVQ
jgi:hypothetical protein